ncbi:Ras GTPase-activating protein-binding protein 1, partial [Dissostichus eleginoides]
MGMAGKGFLQNRKEWLDFYILRGGLSGLVAELKPVTEHSTARCEAATGDSKKSLVSKSSTFLKINPLLTLDMRLLQVASLNSDWLILMDHLMYAAVDFQLTKEMVMEKPSAQLVGREFVRQYYTLLNQAPDYLHRFYGKNSSYVHGGLDNNGKPAEAVYGQSEIHKRVMALSFRDCHTKIRHVDAHATLNEGVVVQVMGELSNNMQPMRKFMQTFVLAPEGTVANKFYVHNDVFRYQDEVFGDSDSEPPEESEDEVEEIEERIPSPDIAQEDSAPFYDPTPCSEPTAPGDDEEVAASPEPEPEEEKEVEVVELKPETPLETQTETNTSDEQTEKSPAAAPPTAEPIAAEPTPTAPEENRQFSWASVTSKNLPPSGAVPVSGVPHVVKAPTAP